MLTPGLLLLRIIAVTLLAAAALGLGAYLIRRRRVGLALGDAALLRQLMGDDLLAIPWGRVIPVAVAALAISLALLDPALAARPTASRGAVILLLDASGSMLVEDGPRRLDLQREVAQDLIRQLPEVAVGVVAFAGRAFSLTPPTRDRAAVAMYLATLDPTIVTQTGSALGAAIRQGITLLAASGESTRGATIVLFGDGDDTEDAEAALDAAELARRAGVAVHVVGVGTLEGGPVPALDPATGRIDGFLHAPDGSIQISRLQEDLLRSIASRSAGGRYVSARDPEAGSVLAESIRPRATAVEVEGGRVPRFAWLAGAALLMLLVEPLGGRRGGHR